MERQIIVTADGSHSVSIPQMNVTYHSVHGAIQESQHVFIDAGLQYGLERFKQERSCCILEMGFGTGLNALLTLIALQEKEQKVHYTGLELFPLGKEEYSLLNYCNETGHPVMQPLFEMMHSCEWEKDIEITPEFILHKTSQSLLAFRPEKKFNLVYFDAFAPAAQPELWTKEVFEFLYHSMLPHAVLVTYCSKGDVRRAMQAAGFMVQKIPGPPRKREMLRAVKQ